MQQSAPSLRILFVALIVAVLTKSTSLPRYYGTLESEPPTRASALRAPFGDDLRGDCCAFLSLQAESLLRERLAATGGIPLMNVRTTSPEFFWVYDHHTPGTAWVTALAFRCFGVSEAAARCVALGFSLLLVLVWFFSFRRVHSSGAVGLGLGALLLSTAGWTWGTHLNYEVPTLPFVLGFLWSVSKNSDRTPWRAVAWIVAAFCFDLVAVFALGAWALEECCFRSGRPRWRRSLLWLAMGVALIAFWAFWKSFPVGRTHEESGGLGAYLASVSMFAAGLDHLAWCRAVGGHLVALYGPILPFVLALECALSLRPEERQQRSSRVLRASTLVGICVLVVPAVRSIDHPYYSLHLLVPVALATCRAAERLGSFARPRGLTPKLEWALVSGLAAVLAWPAARSELSRTIPAVDRPSNSRMGIELSRLSQEHGGALICVPAETSLNPITVSWYARFPVAALPPDDEDGLLYRRDFLWKQGLALEDLLLALDAQWPGRGGVLPLPIPEYARSWVPDPN